MMIGSYNTIRPRKPINGFPAYPEENKKTIFQINDFYKTKNRDLIIPMPPTGLSFRGKSLLASNHENLEATRRSQSENQWVSTQLKNKNKSKSAPVAKKLLYQVENYCDNTTLHGLRYVGDPTLSLCERLFWFCSFGIAACLAGYFISNIYVKWSDSPVIISFSPSDADLNTIPFPSITICNMNQAKRHEAERILQNGSPAQKKLLQDYCNLNGDINETESETDWDTMQNFLITVGQSCGDMLKSCYWKNDPVNCDDYFNNDLTDEGLCCSFNRLPPNKIYWNPKSTSFLNQTYSNFLYDWNPADGFPDKIVDENSEYIPRRPLGSGQHLGLTIILDTQVDNYYCSSTYSVGFKIVLANPLETPKTADFGFLLSPGVEARYTINPIIREATESLRSVSIEKRQCYFSDERRLQYYRSYTTNNCYHECQSNYTFQMCGCIPYYLPQSRGRRICAKRDENCVKTVQDATNIVNGRAEICDCLPGCAEVSFGKSGSTAPLAFNYKELSNFSIDYIRTYTERNCLLECLSNHTKAKCGCIPYFLPKARDVTTCSKKQARCQFEAKNEVEVASTKGQAITSHCSCLPGCNEVTYLKTSSYSNLKLEYYRNESKEVEEEYKKNTAIAHFFFEKSKFSKQVKSVVFGFTDLVSNCGGLLGLFVGFSLLSLIEFFYFLTIRLVCKKMRRPPQKRSRLSQRLFG